MEIINVESRTWEMMMAGLETFAQRVETLCHCTGDKTLQKWLDNQEVCDILKYRSGHFKRTGTMGR